jgi:hypothetical protein
MVSRSILGHIIHGITEHTGHKHLLFCILITHGITEHTGAHHTWYHGAYWGTSTCCSVTCLHGSPQAPRHIERGGIFLTFLTSATDGGEWSALISSSIGWHMLSRHNSLSGRCGDEKHLLNLLGIEPQLSSLSIQRLSYPGSRALNICEG